ncbi:hypothetical protein B7G54_23315 [Burkholderia puraquae]|uniref:Uncharacterized protein n=1 Tax=Burkholderia puraquae TaxID=1904757 RepID=A0A1X1PCA1_9BURK|nr:hypothetical protein B7G54_23315 [Burkholderia puraquae]
MCDIDAKFFSKPARGSAWKGAGQGRAGRSPNAKDAASTLRVPVLVRRFLVHVMVTITAA